MDSSEKYKAPTDGRFEDATDVILKKLKEDDEDIDSISIQ